MNSLICKILIFLSFFILVFIFWPEFIFAQECQICNWSFSPPNPQTGQSVNITLEVGNCNFPFNFLSIYEYGDGTMQGPVVSCPTPRCTLNLGSHTYNKAGTYNLTVVSCWGGLWVWNCNNDGIWSFLIRNCSGSVTVSEPGGVIDPHLRCGDGIIQLRDVQLQGIDEECDCGGLGTIPFNCTPARLNNRDCSSFPVDPSNPAAGNFTGGDLSCFPPGHPNQCTFDTSQCTTSATPPTRLRPGFMITLS